MAKPPFVAWHPNAAPAGCAFYAPLTEGYGAPRDAFSRQPATVVGAPTWGSGQYGIQRSGYGSAAYDKFAPMSTSGVYPCWMAALFQTSSATVQTTIGQGNTGDNNPLLCLTVNSNGTLLWQTRDTAGTLANLASSQANATDGKWHVIMGVDWTSNSQQVFFDGVSGGTSAISIGAVTYDNLCVGVSLRTGTTNWFSGSLAIAAAGFGAVPNPFALYQEWISGTFAAIRPRWLPQSPAVTTLLGYPRSPGRRRSRITVPAAAQSRLIAAQPTPLPFPRIGPAAKRAVLRGLVTPRLLPRPAGPLPTAPQRTGPTARKPALRGVFRARLLAAAQAQTVALPGLPKIGPRAKRRAGSGPIAARLLPPSGFARPNPAVDPWAASSAPKSADPGASTSRIKGQ